MPKRDLYSKICVTIRASNSVQNVNIAKSSDNIDINEIVG